MFYAKVRGYKNVQTPSETFKTNPKKEVTLCHIVYLHVPKTCPKIEKNERSAFILAQFSQHEVFGGNMAMMASLNTVCVCVRALS